MLEGKKTQKLFRTKIVIKISKFCINEGVERKMFLLKEDLKKNVMQGQIVMLESDAWKHV